MSSAQPRGETDPTVLVLRGLQRTIPRVDALEVETVTLRADVERGRREDVSRIADKIERMGERISKEAGAREERIHARLDRFEEIQGDMREEQKDLCDKGQKDHAAMKDVSADLARQIATIQTALSVKSAKEEGRQEILGRIARVFTWSFENWGNAGKAAAGLLVVLTVAKEWWPDETPAYAGTAPRGGEFVAVIPPVTDRQPTLAQSHVEDWPLRTE